MYRLFIFEIKCNFIGSFLDVEKDNLIPIYMNSIDYNEEKMKDLQNWLNQKHKAGDMWQWFNKIEVLYLGGV